MLEILFSLMTIAIPISAILFKKFIPFFLLTVIGANPYMSAGGLLLALGIRIKDIFKFKINKSLLILIIIWLCYSLIMGIIHPSFVFVSEYIQLIIASLLLMYVYNTINTKQDLNNILKYLMYSGLLLSIFEIVIFLIAQDINTLSFVGSISSNYASFYLVITTVIIPIYFAKQNVLNYFYLIPAFFAIYINESRAMMLLSLLLIVKQFTLFNKYNKYNKIIVFIIFVAILLLSYVYIMFNPASIYNPESIFSVLNFENNFSNLERLKLLSYSYTLFMQNLFGYGLGSSYEIFTNNPLTVVHHYPHPHNTFAFMSVELGLVGAMIYIYFFVSLFRSVQKIHNRNIHDVAFNLTLALFLFSCVDVLFYNGILMLISFMIYGVVLSSSKGNIKC